MEISRIGQRAKRKKEKGQGSRPLVVCQALQKQSGPTWRNFKRRQSSWFIISPLGRYSLCGFLVSTHKIGGSTLEIEIIVLSAIPWEMPDERTGEIRKGVSLMFTDGLAMDKSRGSGWEVQKASIPIERRSSLKAVPGIYRASMRMTKGQYGKLGLKLDDVSFVGDVTILPGDQVERLTAVK